MDIYEINEAREQAYNESMRELCEFIEKHQYILKDYRGVECKVIEREGLYSLLITDSGNDDVISDWEVVNGKLWIIADMYDYELTLEQKNG